MEFYNTELYIKTIDILLLDLQNRKGFEKKMEELEKYLPNLQNIFDTEPQIILKLFKEILGTII